MSRADIARGRRALLAAMLLAGGATLAAAQGADPAELTGTLAKVRASGTIVLGHRESSIPFSYLSPRGAPIGYSVDLCKLVVEAIGEELGRDLAIKWVAVTSETRIPEPCWAREECGRPTPAVPHARMVRPEQSNALGPTAP